MGYFGAFLFDGKSWMDADAGVSVVPEAEYWLHVHIHDSDITAITYHPTGPGSGVAYLGFTPRTYFEDPNASLPTDANREAAGLAAWWAGRQAGATDADRDAKTASLRSYLAEDLGPEDNGPDDEEDHDDASVFVELKTDRFLVTLGLPPLPTAG